MDLFTALLVFNIIAFLCALDDNAMRYEKILMLLCSIFISALNIVFMKYIYLL